MHPSNASTNPPDNLWAELHRLRTENAQQRDKIQAISRLLTRAKGITSGWYRLHLASVAIGKYEPVSESGVIDAETSLCREMVESADLLSADISKHLLAAIVVPVENKRDYKL